MFFFHRTINSHVVEVVIIMAILFNNILAATALDPITDENIYTAVALYFSTNKAAAINQYGNISLWDTSNVTNMTSLFRYRASFNEDISMWNTSKVTDMSMMFQQASTFNGDIARWNTGAVTTMYAMFYEASTFSGNLTSWNTAWLLSWWQGWRFCDTPSTVASVKDIINIH